MPNGFQSIKIDLDKPGQGYLRPHKVAENGYFQALIAFIYPYLFPFCVKTKNLIMGTRKVKNVSSKSEFSSYNSFLYILTRVATLLDKFT